MNGKRVYRCQAHLLPVDEGPVETCNKDTQMFIVSHEVGTEIAVCEDCAIPMSHAHRLLFGTADLRRQVSKMVERWGSEVVKPGELT